MLDKIRVLVADTNYLARKGLQHLLDKEHQFQLVGEAANRQDLLAMLPKMEPQVVLLQCHAQGGFEVGDVHDILRLCPQSNVLIMAHHPDRNQVYKLLESGAKSFLLQECDQDEILSALGACAKGEKFFCDRVLDVLIQPSESGISGDSFKKNGPQERNLTPREAEILEYIGSGMSTSEIARTLMLSTHTVHTHRKNIMRKLGVHKTSDLIRKAVRS